LNIITRLRDLGWQPFDFNWNGVNSPYCRVGISIIKRCSVFEPMSRISRMQMKSIKMEKIFYEGEFEIDYDLYAEEDGMQLVSRWISDQENFQFNERCKILSFGLTSMHVWQEAASSRFEIGYGACQIGQAFKFAH
jgi:hypothetical protein